MVALPKSKKTLLPFAISSLPNEAFNHEVEKAAVFCLAELNREKGGGFFKKREREKLVFVSKIYYPFWLAPFGKWTLLLDGLNIVSQKIIYPALPDVKAFKKTLKGHQMTRQVHANFLSNNQNCFRKEDEQSLTVEGLLNDAEFTGELMNNVREAKSTNSPIVDAVLITPALDEVSVLRMLQNVEDTRSKLKEEIADLNEIIKLLNMKNRHSHASLREDIKTTEKKFHKKIQKVKTIRNAKVAKINKAYSAEVTKVSKKFEQKIKALQKEILKTEKIKEQLNAEIEHIEAEIKTSAINKDYSAEQKWKEKRHKVKGKAREIATKLKKMEKKNQELEDTKKNKLFQLKQSNDDKIKEAGKELVEIEASRDAEVKLCQNEMEKIEELTSNIIDRVHELAKNREAVILQFDELGIKQQRTKISLIYIPFYLSCYQSKSEKRYTYFAPSTVSDRGLSTRLKGIGKTKISQLFQPRSNRIVSILNSFIGLLDENIVFKCEISEACLKANLLQMEKAQDSVRSGLDKLNEQGWLSSNDFELFSRAVSQFFK